VNWGDLWGFYTLLLLVGFVAVVVWAWSAKRARAFHEAANLPFLDEQGEKNRGPAESKEAHHE
jgi:cytochrome c oxidase cbb3-type subunit 4